MKTRDTPTIISREVGATVADPGFPRREEGEGRQPLSLGGNLLLDKIFAKNYRKMKEITPRRKARVPSTSAGSANGQYQ